MSTLFIGVMSGTSLDGVDAVLVDFSHGCHTMAYVAIPMPQALREDFLRLNQAGANELHLAALPRTPWQDFISKQCKTCWDQQASQHRRSQPLAHMAKLCAINPSIMMVWVTPCN